MQIEFENTVLKSGDRYLVPSRVVLEDGKWTVIEYTEAPVKMKILIPEKSYPQDFPTTENLTAPEGP